MIKNVKTVDPRDKSSPKVFQLETAMGAAIESFDGAAALVVRTRLVSSSEMVGSLLLRPAAPASTAMRFKSLPHVARLHSSAPSPPRSLRASVAVSLRRAPSMVHR